jgi:hypothetical protein
VAGVGRLEWIRPFSPVPVRWKHGFDRRRINDLLDAED